VRVNTRYINSTRGTSCAYDLFLYFVDFLLRERNGGSKYTQVSLGCPINNNNTIYCLFVRFVVVVTVVVCLFVRFCLVVVCLFVCSFLLLLLFVFCFLFCSFVYVFVFASNLSSSGSITNDERKLYVSRGLYVILSPHTPTSVSTSPTQTTGHTMAALTVAFS